MIGKDELFDPEFVGLTRDIDDGADVVTEESGEAGNGDGETNGCAHGGGAYRRVAGHPNDRSKAAIIGGGSLMRTGRHRWTDSEPRRNPR